MFVIYLLAHVTVQEIRVAGPHFKKLLYNLGSNAPACQLAKPCVHAVLLKFAEAQQLTLEEVGNVRKANPALCVALVPYIYNVRDSPLAVQSFVKALVAAAKACFEPTTPENFKKHVKRAAKDPRTGVIDIATSQRTPEKWSAEESFFRTGCFSGVAVSKDADWQVSELGGSHVRAGLQRYAADGLSTSKDPACTKHKDCSKKLVPGLLLAWCEGCRKCVYFGIMQNAESPRALFEALFTQWPQLPPRVSYDNGCNFHSYVLNREPAYFKDMQVFIDASHYKGHKLCCRDYNTGSYKHCFNNSSLAEQKNSHVRKIESQAAYMGQVTFLLYVRYFLHRMNEGEEHQRFWAA